MADQASVRDTRTGTSATGNGSVTGTIAGLGNDVATLVELQAKLAAQDARECLSHALVPLGFIAIASAVLLGGVPVVLLGIADVLARAIGIAPGWAMLLTAAVAMTAAGLVALLCLGRVRVSLEPLRRSREELSRNIAWLRTVLLHSGRAYPRRGM
jgi:hypothetical protein